MPTKCGGSTHLPISFSPYVQVLHTRSKPCMSSAETEYRILRRRTQSTKVWKGNNFQNTFTASSESNEICVYGKVACWIHREYIKWRWKWAAKLTWNWKQNKHVTYIDLISIA
jgi:hypothetical protein